MSSQQVNGPWALCRVDVTGPAGPQAATTRLGALTERGRGLVMAAGLTLS